MSFLKSGVRSRKGRRGIGAIRYNPPEPSEGVIPLGPQAKDILRNVSNFMHQNTSFTLSSWKGLRLLVVGGGTLLLYTVNGQGFLNPGLVFLNVFSIPYYQIPFNT